MRRTRFAYSCLCVVSLGLLGCDPSPASSVDAGADAALDAQRTYEPEPFAPSEATRAYCQGDDDAIEARITQILRTLSPAEKVALMHGAALAAVDGVWLVRGSERVGVPGLHMLDGPRGLSSFSEKNGTAFPVAITRGATWDTELERRVGAAMALELRSAGGDVLLAPTINILTHPRWGRAQETYSEDVHHLGAMGLAFIEGVQSQGVLASAKHFAANSIEATRHDVDVQVDERTLREIYLPHFRRAVVEGRVASVMSAYNSVNGAYCDLNSHLLQDILRGEWGFAGFVESDWVLGTHGDVASVRAGLDIEMPLPTHFRRLPGALARGEIEEREIDSAVRRIVRAQLCFGLDTRERVLDDPSQRETAAHLALAREVAQRGIVLLRNEPARGAPAGSAAVLPISLGAVSRIALIGPLADVENIGDEGSSRVTPSDVVTALEGITAAAPGASISHHPEVVLDAAAEAAIRAADVAIVFIGLAANDEGEGTISFGAGDRASLDVPAAHVALVRAVTALHGSVIVVLEGGGTQVVRPFVDEVQALVLAGYPGAQGGHAIADVLFGLVSPAGRLPYSVPRAESDLPPFDNVSTTVTYTYFHGYRHLAREGTPAEYPFGFGLSYTSFAYSDLSITDAALAEGTLEVQVTVTNTGARAGIDTPQLYVSVPASSVPRAERDLRAFGRVELEAGASERITLRVPASDLAYWDEASDAWVLEAARYEVRIAAHAQDPGVSASFDVSP